MAQSKERFRSEGRMLEDDRCEKPGFPQREASGNGGGASPRTLEDFVRDYGNRAFQFAFRLSGNVDEAKDVVQESFFRALKHWDRYDASRPFDSWLFKIVRNVFLDARKRSDRRHLLPVGSVDSVSGVSEEGVPYVEFYPLQEEEILSRLERKEEAQMVRMTLAQITDEHRAILTLCDMEELTYLEIADVLDVPVGTVRSRVSRARRAFRSRLLKGNR